MDLLGSIMGSMEKPPSLGDEEKKKAKRKKSKWCQLCADQWWDKGSGEGVSCRSLYAGWDFYPVVDLFPASRDNAAMLSKNYPDASGYFHVNFFPSLIALLITQSAHRGYSSVNDINGIFLSIMSCCWFEARFCHKLGECFIYVRKHWNAC